MKYPMREFIQLSKFLSYVLRHNPDTIGLTMASNGWVNIDELLLKMNNSGNFIDRDVLSRIVREDSKSRYAISEDGLYIRANQGHSVPIDLQLDKIDPPALLFHGTAGRNIISIKASGLLKQQRHHVHLSESVEIAKQVGSRYGKPVVLTINAKEMAANGFLFYCSDNGVWLTEHVPVDYIAFPD